MFLLCFSLHGSVFSREHLLRCEHELFGTSMRCEPMFSPDPEVLAPRRSRAVETFGANLVEMNPIHSMEHIFVYTREVHTRAFKGW